MDDIKSGSLFKRNINISEELGTLKRTFVPNSVTYTESEIAEEKRRMAKRSTPNCTACPDCPPYGNDPDEGDSKETPPNQGLPGDQPSSLFQSTIGYAENGNPLSYVFSENGKTAWETLYEYMFSPNKGRTDFVFIGEHSLVHEDNPASGDMVGGFADGFAKGLLELSGRGLYGTPIYYGNETVTAPSYDPLDENTSNDPNPNGYGSVMVGTRNVYDTFTNPDGSISFYTPSDDPFSLSDRAFEGFQNLYNDNLDPTFYSYYLPSAQNGFKIRDGGERDPYYQVILSGNQDGDLYVYDRTLDYNNYNSAGYHGRRIFTSSLLNTGTNAQSFWTGLTISVDLKKNNNNEWIIPHPDRGGAQSYFTVDGLFEHQTLSFHAFNQFYKVAIGKGTANGNNITVDSFFYYSIKYGLVPPYLGKWYSPSRQLVTWQTGDDYQVDSTKQKIIIQNQTSIFDPNTNTTIDLSDTTKNYLNNIFPNKPITTNDVSSFELVDGIIYFTITIEYLMKLRYVLFNWQNFDSMPGFDETSIFPSITPWDILPLDQSAFIANGNYAPQVEELTTRFNNTRISNIDSTTEFQFGMPDAYQYNDGWYTISFPADFFRRVGLSDTTFHLDEQKVKNYYEEKKLNFLTENSIGNKQYQIGLPVSQLFRIFKVGLFSKGPTILFNSTANEGRPFGSTYNQQEFCTRSYYYSGYDFFNGSIKAKQNDKSRRVKCFMKTGLYMNSSDSFYTKTTKEPIYSSSNFKYIVGYVKPPIISTPSSDINETLRNSTITLSITPEANNGTLGTSYTNSHVQIADDLVTKLGFVDLSANLSSLSSNYTKLNLSFLGYNTENKTEGEVVITTHSAVDANNSNGVSFSVFAVDPAIRLADIEYSFRSNGFTNQFLEMFRHIKERQTNSSYGGTNTNSKVVIVWLSGRQEEGNKTNIPLYGGAQGQGYMAGTFPVIEGWLRSVGFAPSDVLHLFVSHPKASSFVILDETGRCKKDPLQYTNLADNDPRSIFNGIMKSIFYPFNENQNPTGGFLKNKRNATTPDGKVNFINSYRLFNPDTQKYEHSPMTENLATKVFSPYYRNILYFDTPAAQGTVNINNRLNDSHYSVVSDVNGVPIVSYKFLNERGYLQVGKDIINIMKNGL